MDDRRFDHLTRVLAAALPRRVLAGAALAAAARLAAGAGDEAVSRRRKKKKKKPQQPPAGCPNRSCLNKVCGQDDGCGGKCTVPAGCDQDEACIGGGCVANVCTPACMGNKLCQLDGSCACPQGFKQRACDAFNCVECCPDPFLGNGDKDCEGHPNGPFCTTVAGNPVLHCTCASFQKRCGDGRCAPASGCCGEADCLIDIGPGSFCNANGACVCPEDTDVCGPPLGCRDTLTDRFACGQNCTPCPAGRLCENGNCCIGLANDCGFDSSNCCAGLQCNNIGTVFEPEFVCGDPP